MCDICNSSPYLGVQTMHTFSDGWSLKRRYQLIRFPLNEASIEPPHILLKPCDVQSTSQMYTQLHDDPHIYSYIEYIYSDTQDLKKKTTWILVIFFKTTRSITGNYNTSYSLCFLPTTCCNLNCESSKFECLPSTWYMLTFFKE